METRNKRRQQEQESAVTAAPVQTRAQKAARIAGQAQSPSTTVPVDKKRKQSEQAEPSKRNLSKRSRAPESQAPEKVSKEPSSSHQKASPRLRKDQEPPKPPVSVAKEVAEEMDRQRRDARKELEEAARMEQVLGLTHGK
jgi:hypothetical protein